MTTRKRTAAPKDLDGLPKPDYEKMVKAIRGISGEYYTKAISLGVHAFIEHTGIINEHIKLFQEAAAMGLQAEHINVHGSVRFPMESFQAQYLGEKFACIFAPYFTKETLEVFVEQIRKELK